MAESCQVSQDLGTKVLKDTRSPAHPTHRSSADVYARKQKMRLGKQGAENILRRSRAFVRSAYHSGTPSTKMPGAVKPTNIFPQIRPESGPLMVFLWTAERISLLYGDPSPDLERQKTLSCSVSK